MGSDLLPKASLSTPLRLGDVQLRNRNIMSSLTRNRSVPTTIPNDANLEYYVQRAQSAGLLMTEGTLISPQGTQWPNAPGIWSDEHVTAWERITQAVHDQGSLIFVQLWHLGRIANNDMPEQKLAGHPVEGPSAIGARGGRMRHLPSVPGYSVPVAMKDPWKLVEQFKHAAENAKRAGFDGAELHSAFGYVIHQFLDSTSNKRTDMWGGSIENRARLGLEVLKVMVEVFGPGRVGIKLNPAAGGNDVGMPLEETIEIFSYYIKEMCKLGLAYIQLLRYMEVMDPVFDDKKRGTPHDVLETYGPLIKAGGVRLLLNGGLTIKEANELIAAGKIDAAVFGQLWLGNPDLQFRVENGLDVNTTLDYRGFFEVVDDDPRRGYTDYPFAQKIAPTKP